MDPNLGPPETNVVCAEVTDCDHPSVVDKVADDLVSAGLICKEDILDSNVVTRNYSYPVYRCDYEKGVDAAQAFLAHFKNLRCVGRAAQFEHMEVDDCFTAAGQLVREIMSEQEQPTELSSTKRSELPVEPLLAAVVASAGSQEDTVECISSIIESDYKQLVVALVTAPSEEDLRVSVKEKFPQVQLLTRPEEMGIPAAFNVGCNWATKQEADFVFLCLGLTVVEPDALSALVRTAQRDPEAGILAPKILSYERREYIWAIGTQFRKFPPSIKMIGPGQPDDARFAVAREVEFAVSSGLLVKRAVLEQVGLFDPGYRFYYEDIDFCQRARLGGFRIRFAPEARMYHKEAHELSRTPSFHRTWGESFARYYRRHVRPLAVILPVHMSYLLLREALTGNIKNVPALAKGIFKGLHQRMGEPPELGADFFEAG